MIATFPSAALVLIPQWVLIAIAAAVVGARIYLHVVLQHKRVETADSLSICALVASIASASFDIWFAYIGVLDTNPDNDPPPIDAVFENIQKVVYISSFFYFTAFYLCKAALLAFYHQLFVVFMRKRRAAYWFVAAYTAAAYVVTILASTTLCGNISAYWAIDPEQLTTCVPDVGEVLYAVTSSLNFSCDLMLFCLPFLILHKLEMPRKLKITVWGTFLLGLINLTVSLIRFLVIQVGAFSDGFNLPAMELLAAVELNTALIIACLPSLRGYLGGRSASEPRRSIVMTIGGSNGRRRSAASAEKTGSCDLCLDAIGDDNDAELGRATPRGRESGDLAGHDREDGIGIEGGLGRDHGDCALRSS